MLFRSRLNSFYLAFSVDPSDCACASSQNVWRISPTAFRTADPILCRRPSRRIHCRPALRRFGRSSLPVAAAYGDFGLRPIRLGSRRRFLFFPCNVKPVLHELGVLCLHRSRAPEADLVLFEAHFLGSLFSGSTKDCRSNQSLLKIWSMI